MSLLVLKNKILSNLNGRATTCNSKTKKNSVCDTLNNISYGEFPEESDGDDSDEYEIEIHFEYPKYRYIAPEIEKQSTTTINPCLRNPKEIFASLAKSLRSSTTTKAAVPTRHSGGGKENCEKVSPKVRTLRGQGSSQQPQSFSNSLQKNFEIVRESLKHRVQEVSETARAWSATSGVPSLMGGNQHQRLDGRTDDLLSPTSPQTSYQSSPTLLERGKDKGANLFGGSEGGYQRLNNQSSSRKDSWGGDGWGQDWDTPEKDSAPVGLRKENLSSPKSEERQNSMKKSPKVSAVNENKPEGGNLLIDFDAPSSQSNTKKEKTGASSGGHTWDNWDEDEWEKLE